MADSYLRFPHLHADLLTFVAEDDVWIAPLDGGRPWRLSADRVPAAYPRFSPDGTQVAWTSWRDGAPEAHVAPVDGGPAQRLTYWGNVKTRARGWAGDAEVLAVTAAGAASVRRTWAHAVPVDGGAPRRLPFGPVETVSVAGDAVLLGSPLSREPGWWKRYRGGTAGTVWLGSTGGGFRRILTELDGHLVDPSWVQDRIVLLSDHEGVGNVYSVTADGGDLGRHSDHDSFYARHLGTDGERVVYESAGELWLIDGLAADSAPRRLDVRLGGPRTGRTPRPVPAPEHLGALSVDGSGRAAAIEVRGTVHWLTAKDGPATALAAEPGVRHRLPVVLGDGRAAWVTDAEGDDALEVGGRDVEPRRFATGRVGRVLELVAAPDGNRLAAATHDGRLLLVEVTAGEVRELARSEYGDCTGLAFSPDSAWLAWSHPGPVPVRQIRLAPVAGGDILDVTSTRFADTEPVFTRDGAHLAFLSARSFDPVYDAHVFDLSFPTGTRPYLVALTAGTPSPFDPEPGGRELAPAPKRTDADGEPAPPVVTVDPDGLAERLVPVPVPEGRYASLHAAAGGLLWIRRPISGSLGDGREGTGKPPRPVLERYDLSRRKVEVLVDSLDRVALSGDGTRVVVRDEEELRVLPADRKIDDPESDDVVRVDLDRLRVTVDPAAEWRQMFDEAGRLMRDHFWTPDMAGIDWDAVLAEYRPLVERVGSHDDLVDVLWEVAGELGTSHAYVTPREHGDDTRRQGLLGADVERDAGGTWRVARVLPGESSDPRARSPLTAPGAAVRAGDGLLAVGGRPVEPGTGPGPLLAGTAGRPLELLVAPADGSTPRRVVVVPVDDEERLRYQDWVAERRAYVLRTGGGRVGYLHVPDMMGHGWAQLHRDLHVETLREALVVDVRENRGGHVSQLVVEKLARRTISWDLGRHHVPGTYPADAPRGPVVAVANEFSGSDGDIVTAAIKRMGIGPVVGKRTWGGVIGIDMRYALVDGTGVTQPRYATWFDGHGWDIENHGVAPDVEVDMTPDDWAAGRDPQLDTAVRMALAALQEHPAVAPPDVSTRPSRRRPPLPPR